MSNQELDPQRRLVAERAIGWLMLLQTGKMSARERAEFADWLRASPLHVAEMLRVSRVDVDLTEFRNWKKYAKDSTADVELAQETGIDNLIPLSEFQIAAPTRRARSIAPFVATAMAAGLAAVAVLGGWFHFGQRESVIRTQIAERRELTLADGSVVDLAPATELHVQMKEHERLVDLVQGQAFFHVAKDANKPFIVDAGHARVRAVGTAFNVDRGDDAVTVTVTEGRVAVRRATAPTSQPGSTIAGADIFLTANEQIVMTRADLDAPVREVNAADASAWVDGKFIFKNETVSDAARRFNLYNRSQIRVLDAALAAQRVSGVFRASDPESFVAFVKTTTSSGSEASNVIRLDEQKK